HGLSVTSYKLPSTDSKNLFNYMYGVYESYIMFDRLVRTYNRTGSFIYNYPSGLIFSDRAEDSPNNEVTMPADLHSSDYWATVFEGTVTLPVSGYYRFRTVVDDAFILAIDGQHMCAATNVCTATETHYLNAGQHAFYLGLVEWTGDAYVNVWILQPGETSYKPLPMDWLTPLSGASQVVGEGAILSNPGASFMINSAGGRFTPFTGTFNGPVGASLFKTGYGDFWTGYGAGGLINRAGILTVTSPAATYPSLSISGGGITLVNGGTVESLAGVGTLGFGSTVKKVYFTGDADCGISPDKTYTHRINFPTTQTVTINGLEFGAIGDFELKNWSTGQANRAMGAEDGICRMMEYFWYGSVDQSITLTGLQPDTAYEARFYFRNWDNNCRYGRMIFSAGSRGAGAIDCEFDSGWGAKDQMGYVACRYRTDEVGTFTTRVLSLVYDKIHIYGMSNELVEDASPAPAVLTISTPSDVRSAYRGAIGGDGTLVKSGTGTQIFAGPLSVSDKILVSEGTAVFEKPTLAQIEVAPGATVALHSGASVKGLAGTGIVQLDQPDPQPWGELQADGTFAAVPFPKLIRFTGDADCGVSSSKTYPLAMSLANVSDYEDVIHINDVVFRRGSPGGAVERDYRSGWTVQGTPATKHGGGNAGSIGTGSDQGIYQVLYGMNYGGSGAFVQHGLTANVRYETRIYMRIWDPNNVNRSVRIAYVDGGVEKEITFNEDDPSDRRPYYVACQYTATSNDFPIVFQSLANDGFHLYGLSTEVVGDSARTFDIDDDQTFSGTVLGDGEIRKTGIGSITFSGFFYNDAPLTVKQGAFLLGNVDSRIGNVAVQAGGAFGGIGEVGGSLGFAAGSRLVSGTASEIGTLTVRGGFVAAEGTDATFRFKGGHTGGFEAESITLPNTFNVDLIPTAGDNSLPASGVLFRSDDGFGSLDLTDWTLTANGEPLPSGAKVSFSSDGTCILFQNAAGTVMIIN
ncbi:MAG: hypothetical protein J6336_02030, partial [Kiritimatiellae bacterium]|nr:hypothetical protein [Kiritimatiellia bacterium]